MPCDFLGNYLPPGTLPPPNTLPGEGGTAHNYWDPFHNRAQFEIADFLYRRNQMPGTQVDVLFDLWTASSDMAQNLLFTATTTFMKPLIPYN